MSSDLQTRLDETVEKHNNLVQQIQNGEEQLKVMRNELQQTVGRAILLQELLAPEENGAKAKPLKE